MTLNSNYIEMKKHIHLTRYIFYCRVSACFNQQQNIPPNVMLHCKTKYFCF